MVQLLWVCLIGQTNVTLQGNVPLNQMSTNPNAGNDIWGFTDAIGREYAVMGTNNSTGVFNLSDPTNPVEVGMVPGLSSSWRDVKTFIFNDSPGSFSAYAFVTTEASGQGLQIINLSNVPNSISLAATYSGNGLSTAHNIFIEPNAKIGTHLPYAYILGANINSGGVTVLDISNPTSPIQVGFWNNFYVHDFYLGHVWADPDFNGKEIGVAFCGQNNISLIDFTDKSAPVLIDDYTYPNINYSHSGWVSDDGRYLFACDELDELNATLNTTIRVFDLIDMNQPTLVHIWTGPTRAIDHNAFAKDGFLHFSNYTRGYTVLDISNPLTPTEYAHFDTYPNNDGAIFAGAWGTFPYFDSGLAVVSDIESGLFVLQPDLSPGFNMSVSKTLLLMCSDSDSEEIVITTNSVLDFSNAITFSIQNLPANVSAVFSQNPVTPGQSTSFHLQSAGTITPGTYAISLRGMASGADERMRILDLVVDHTTLSPPNLLGPAEGQACIGNQNLNLSWSSMGPNRSYHVQVSDQANFSTIAWEITTTDTQTQISTQLNLNRTYYWRVQTLNGCGPGAFSAAQTFFTSRPSILLVDDDDNSPNVRSYYTNLLDQIGISYDVFDVGGGAGNGPNLATLNKYEWIIWFSGDQYGSGGNDEAGPNVTDEGNLTSYLNNGGHLFLSSEDYYDDRGQTSFLTNMLGVASCGNDTGNYTSVTGTNSYAPYGALGLVPTVGNEFFDIVNAGMGSLVFQGNNGNGAGVATANTLFFGFTFESLIANNNATAQQIFMDLIDTYQITDCQNSACLQFDTNQNGVEISDLQVRYPEWSSLITILDLVPIATCLGN